MQNPKLCQIHQQPIIGLCSECKSTQGVMICQECIDNEQSAHFSHPYHNIESIKKQLKLVVQKSSNKISQFTNIRQEICELFQDQSNFFVKLMKQLQAKLEQNYDQLLSQFQIIEFVQQENWSQILCQSRSQEVQEILKSKQIQDLEQTFSKKLESIRNYIKTESSHFSNTIEQNFLSSQQQEPIQQAPNKIIAATVNSEDLMSKLNQLAGKDLLVYAQVKEETEYFDDMRIIMHQYAQLSSINLNVQQRNMLSVAYKNSIGQRRKAWRKMVDSKNNDPVYKRFVQMEKEKLEKEMTQISTNIIDLLEKKLLDQSQLDAEEKVFYLKMKGDYYRYQAEYCQQDQFEKIKQEIEIAYKVGTFVAEQKLCPANPIRVGLALNYSVYLFETIHDVEKAWEYTKKVMEEAQANFSEIDENQLYDSKTIIRLIQDNLDFWKDDYENAKKKKTQK